jgi:DNA replication protein DnaC
LSKGATAGLSSARTRAERPEDVKGNHVCPRCRGAGFVHPTLPNGKPNYARVTPCGCLGASQQENLEQYSNLGALKAYTFDKLSPQGLSGSQDAQRRFKDAFETAKRYATSPKGWLVLVGPSGAGKTHLAAAIASDRLSRRDSVLFITVADLLDHLRSSFSPESQVPYDRFFDQVKGAPLLVLDDLTARAATPWAQEKLDQLLNSRYQNELPTVITTEIAPADMDERWRNRLSDVRLSQIFLLGEDSTELDLAWREGFNLQRTMTFQNFDHRRVNLSPEVRDNLERAYHLALDFASKPEGWLVFQGVTGAGKTHLAAAIVNYRYQAHKPAFFVVVPEFLDHLRGSFSPDAKTTYDQLFERVKTTPLLVLDDFGEHSATPWAQEKLYQVLNYRYNAQLPTVITMSRALEELEPRISSRLADRKMSVAFNIMAPDYRTDLNGSNAKKPYRRPERRGK